MKLGVFPQMGLREDRMQTEANVEVQKQPTAVVSCEQLGVFTEIQERDVSLTLQSCCSSAVAEWRF